jgi:hypothetical protein
MAQVSRPMLIVLGLTVALAAVWLVALRPKPVAIQNTPLAPTKAIPAAKQASAASDAANAKAEAAARADGQGTTAAPATSSTAKATATPAATHETSKTATGATDRNRGTTGHERTVLREIAGGKVVVMLFWSAAGADDIATRDAVRSLSAHGGKVAVHVIPIGRVGDYGSITRGVKVAQSPTTLIIGHGGQTRTIVGLTEPGELGQAVGDALAKR